jgi:hypothetical protein
MLCESPLPPLSLCPQLAPACEDDTEKDGTALAPPPACEALLHDGAADTPHQSKDPS